MRGRLSAYAGYQLRDFLFGRAAAIVLVTALAAWAYAATHALTPAMLVSADLDARDQLQRAFDFSLAVFAIAGAAVAAQGLVARHRARGYDRVILSRPLSPARYYVQGFAIAGVGTVLMATVGAGAYGVAVRPVSALGVAAYVATGMSPQRQVFVDDLATQYEAYKTAQDQLLLPLAQLVLTL